MIRSVGQTYTLDQRITAAIGRGECAAVDIRIGALALDKLSAAERAGRCPLFA